MPASGRRGLAIIGGGKIGEALLSGLIRRGGVDGLLVCERSPERAAQLAERYGVPAVDLADAAARARVLLLAVKPQDIGVLLERLAGVLGSEQPGGCGGGWHAATPGCGPGPRAPLRGGRSVPRRGPSRPRGSSPPPRRGAPR